jgi:hypothetical protein
VPQPSMYAKIDCRSLASSITPRESFSTGFLFVVVTVVVVAVIIVVGSGSGGRSGGRQGFGGQFADNDFGGTH